MKKIATTAAALAFTASAVAAQIAGPAEAPEPIEPVEDLPLPPVLWESKNFKIYAHDDANGLANTFILTCPDQSLQDDNITLFLYDLDRFGLSSLRIDSKLEAWKASKSGLTDEYPFGYADGMINPDGSVIVAESYGRFAQIIANAFALPVLPASAPVTQEGVLQNIRTFAVNFCYGVS